jgi:hypothetical protein
VRLFGEKEACTVMRYNNVPQWDKNGGKRLSFGNFMGLNVSRLKNCKMLVLLENAVLGCFWQKEVDYIYGGSNQSMPCNWWYP